VPRVSPAEEFAALQQIALSGQRHISSSAAIGASLRAPAGSVATGITLGIGTEPDTVKGSGAVPAEAADAALPMSVPAKWAAAIASDRGVNAPDTGSEASSADRLKNTPVDGEGRQLEQVTSAEETDKPKGSRLKPNSRGKMRADEDAKPTPTTVKLGDTARQAKRNQLIAARHQLEREAGELTQHTASMSVHAPAAGDSSGMPITTESSVRASAEHEQREAASRAPSGTREADLDASERQMPNLTAAPATPIGERDGVTQRLQEMWQSVMQMLRTTASGATSQINETISRVGGAVARAVPQITGIISGAIAHVTTLVTSALAATMSTLTATVSAVNALLESARAAVSRLAERLTGAAGDAVAWLRSQVQVLKRQAANKVLSLIRRVRQRAITYLTAQTMMANGAITMLNTTIRSLIVGRFGLEFIRMHRSREEFRRKVNAALEAQSKLTPEVRASIRRQMCMRVFQIMFTHAQTTSAKIRGALMPGTAAIQAAAIGAHLRHTALAKNIQASISPVAKAVDELVPGSAAELGSGFTHFGALSVSMVTQANIEWVLTETTMRAMQMTLVGQAHMFLTP
ncbi:MAG: hypothetical protein LLG44_10500, partial [Chloroflexi bacterium]|nr:hypothetical protein [Chloroflexota bacterium]